MLVEIVESDDDKGLEKKPQLTSLFSCNTHLAEPTPFAYLTASNALLELMKGQKYGDCRELSHIQL